MKQANQISPLSHFMLTEAKRRRDRAAETARQETRRVITHCQKVAEA